MRQRLFAVALTMSLTAAWPLRVHGQRDPSEALATGEPRSYGLDAPPPVFHPDGAEVARLRLNHQAVGDWAGERCPSIDSMRGFVDDYLATSHPAFPAAGSTIPGMSTSWTGADCGTFTYAAGLRNVEAGKPMTPATLMGIASMTKPVIAAVTLKLNVAGVFGPDGLDTTVDRLLTPGQIAALTIGDDPAHPRCPGTTFLRNRLTRRFEWTPFACPDLSQVTLRHLMVSNHGMYDFLNEVLTPDRINQYFSTVFIDFYRFFGLPVATPSTPANGFEVLKLYGLKRHLGAVIGGNLRFRDWELSLGNTGFQLLGIILEQQTGVSLDTLIRTQIVEPLGLDDLFVYLDPSKRRNLIADGYWVATGDAALETTGIYPLTTFNGHSAVNTLNLGLGLPGHVNLAGGAAGLVANMQSYTRFLDAYVNGGLLGPSGQAEFERGFVEAPDVVIPGQIALNGFGLLEDSIIDHPRWGPVNLYHHDGNLPGVRCENVVIRRPGTAIAPVTGAFCLNSSNLLFPNSFDVIIGFIVNVLNANPRQS